MNLQMKISPKSKNGDTTQGSDYRYHPYGDSAVTAISTSKLGGECLFATRFGNDTNGKRLYEYYKSCGISTALMRKDATAQTGMSISLYTDPEHYQNFVATGASMHFTKEDIDDAFISMPDLFLAPLEEIGCEERTVVLKTEKKEEPDDVLLAQTLERPISLPEENETAEDDDTLEEAEAATEDTESEEEVPVEPASAEEVSDIASETVTSYIERESVARYAMDRAKDRHVDTVLQYTPFTAQYPLSTYDNIKILVISDEMLYQLTGFFPNTDDKALRSLMALSQTVRAKYYIVQQGNHEAFIYDGSHFETVKIPQDSLPNIPGADTKKMHQTFMGALVAEYLESKNVVRAARFAVIASLFTRAKFGNLEKVPTRAELEQYAAEHGIELYR